ncbi:hypothetical protein DMUE_3297 [Dictyocoela muelleri]|nr:hypothetical protein DMUE_3297 [Dictyocoela muelleri]
MKNPNKINSSVFDSVENSLDFLLNIGAISSTIICSCGHRSALIIYKEKEYKRIVYRCSYSNCRKRIGVIKYRTPSNILLQAIYNLMAGTSYDQTKLFLGISKNTISMIKNVFAKFIKILWKEKKTLIGGPGIIVEIYESVICKKGIIRYPTSTDDNIKDSI